MDVKLQRAAVSYYSKTLSIEFAQEEAAENIVPDTLPDITAVIDADAVAVMRSKDISDGRVALSGMITGHILYRSEDEEKLYKMPVQLPFSARWENGSIDPQSKCTARLSLAYFEGRIINSRKILLRAEVVISAELFAAESCEYSAEAESDGLELLRDTLHFSGICAVGEKSFSIADEYQLPASKARIESIEKYRVRLYCDEVRAMGGRIAVKGRAAVWVAYRADGTGELCCVDFTIPFSQVQDSGCDGEISAAAADMMLTGVYVYTDGDGYGAAEGTIRVEIGAVAQFRAWSEREITYISDVYSTKYEVSAEVESCRLKLSEPGSTKEESIAHSISIADDAKNIIDVYACLGKQRMEAGKSTWPVKVRVLYECENGRIESAEGELSAEFELGRSEARCTAEISDITAKLSNGRAELRISVMYTLMMEDELGFATPLKIAVDEERAKDISSQPSIVVLKTDGYTSLWQLAKQFNTTVAAINEVNPELGGTAPEKGTLLLIAKKR